MIAYVSYEMNSQHRYSHLKKKDGSNQPVKPALSPTAPEPATMLASTTPATSAPLPLADAPVGTTNDGKTLAALPVPSLAGFVRSPYTNPPRLVDVKGSTPGATMVCPYTGRPFIVPSEVGTSSAALAKADTPVPAPKLTMTPTPPTLASSEPKKESPAPVTPPAKSPTVAVTPAPAPTPAPAAPVKPKPEVATNTTPAPAPPVTAPAPAPQPAPAAAPDVPAGIPIAGRPGFVNSPYAAKHQLVDVTGLPAGMEVKCPYTGKLFRVPSQEMATSKPSEAPAVASPEKKK